MDKLWEANLKRYDELVNKCERFERKGKTVPTTTANGYMFSQLNKAGELGIRFSPDVQKQYMEAWNSTHFKSYGAVMKGYVRVPEEMFSDSDQLVRYLNESYDYVMSLPPK